MVIAYNDEPNMRACLESITWADEIIVVDSHSTDATERISREFTDKVYQHDFHGFGRLRNEALTHATHDWVFSLDTDERATPELREEIRLVLAAGPEAEAYFVPRKNYFLGRWIKHCGWFPDYRQPQLFRKSRLRYREELVHESFDLDGRIGYLTAAALQYPFRDIDHYSSEAGALLRSHGAAHGRAGAFILLASAAVASLFHVSENVCRAERLSGWGAGAHLVRTLCLLHVHQVRAFLGVARSPGAA